MGNLTDEQITALIAQPKALPQNYLETLRPQRRKGGHLESDLNIEASDGNRFRIIVRRSIANPLDFSVILGVMVDGTLRRLRRYNGSSHEHGNVIEGEVFAGFHIHKATERYAERGFREDAYAVTTSAYADVLGAIELMLDECGFVRPPRAQEPLF